MLILRPCGFTTVEPLSDNQWFNVHGSLGAFLRNRRKRFKPDKDKDCIGEDYTVEG